jgi:RNA-directed DNA polymerase
MEDGSLIARERGTPQGGVISPLLANLFLRYTFDLWMRRNHRISRLSVMPMMSSAIVAVGRRGTYRDHKFDFLGYTFRSRLSRRWHGFGVVFSPAASDKALKKIRQTVRGWALHERQAEEVRRV